MSPREVLARHGLRCTRQRELIFDALMSTKSHPTAEELYNTVRAVEPGLSLATVYNTLEALTSCGLARKIPSPTGTGSCRYDGDAAEHVHIATDDAHVIDVPEDLSRRLLASLPRELLDEVEHRTGVRVDAVSILITGRRVASMPCEAAPSVG